VVPTTAPAASGRRILQLEGTHVAARSLWPHNPSLIFVDGGATAIGALRNSVYSWTTRLKGDRLCGTIIVLQAVRVQ
jgi:hypothetical protein